MTSGERLGQRCHAVMVRLMRTIPPGRLVTKIGSVIGVLLATLVPRQAFAERPLQRYPER